MDNRMVRILLLIGAIICFLGVAVFANDMHEANETVRVLATGLAFFAASFIP